jgi:D-3-phosphoglycerate dehydrogenase / 2-oxoglutarate reductase
MSEDPMIVVCDSIVDTDVVRNQLPAGWQSRIRQQEELPVGIGIVGVLVGPDHDLSAAAMDGLPDLRVAVATSMGWDHIDVKAAASRGIAVRGVEPYCVDEVADHAIALVLNLFRGITGLDRSVRAGAWESVGTGRPLRGAVLGVVGYGRIGAAVAARAQGLGMNVLAYDTIVSGSVPGSEVTFVASLEELVSSSDAVSLHVPLSETTRGLIDGTVLSKFRPGAFLVNVSRGEVIDQEALGVVLSSGALAGAALDVLVREPPSPGDPVLDFPHTILTPHSAWFSPEAKVRLSRCAGSVLSAALAEGWQEWS